MADRKRIGIMGGTLDPVHNGHLAISRAAARAEGLDGVVLLPAGDPPHKSGEVDGEHRLRMAELAAAEDGYNDGAIVYSPEELEGEASAEEMMEAFYARGGARSDH